MGSDPFGFTISHGYSNDMGNGLRKAREIAVNLKLRTSEQKI